MIKRISANRGHEYYSPDCSRYQPTLDGEVVKDCVTANAEEGWVEVYQRDAAGRVMVRGVECVLIRKHGKVEINIIKGKEYDAQRAG